MTFRSEGFEFEVSPLFFVITCTLLFFDTSGYMSFSLLFSAFHEMGHIASMYIVKKPPRAIRIKLYGLEISTNSISYIEALFIALSGPIVNIILALSIYVLWLKFKVVNVDLAIINLFIGLFNLLPINNLDGGDILKNLLLIFNIKNAENIIYNFSIIFSTIIISFGVIFVQYGNFFVLILGICLFICNFVKND